MTGTPSIPTGTSKRNKRTTWKSTPVPTPPPIARMQVHIIQLVAEKEAALRELAQIIAYQTTTSIMICLSRPSPCTSECPPT